MPQLIEGDTTDLRVEYADTDIARRRSGAAGYWYNNGTYTSGMRHYGFPLGHWIGSDATDLYFRFGRQLTDQVNAGVALERSVRGRAQVVPETTREARLDLAWRASRQTELQLGYSLQRTENPIHLTSVNPSFAESAPTGVTAVNRLMWSCLKVDF